MRRSESSHFPTINPSYAPWRPVTSWLSPGNFSIHFLFPSVWNHCLQSRLQWLTFFIVYPPLVLNKSSIHHLCHGHHCHHSLNALSFQCSSCWTWRLVIRFGAMLFSRLVVSKTRRPPMWLILSKLWFCHLVIQLIGLVGIQLQSPPIAGHVSAVPVWPGEH